MVLLPAKADAGVVLEWRNFDPAWCEVSRGCVRHPGDRALLHFPFRIGNRGTGKLSLEPTGALVAACTAPAPTSLRGFVRWELAAASGSGIAAGTSDVQCLRDDEPLEGVETGAAYDCTAQGLSNGFASRQPSPGVCTWADLTGPNFGDADFYIGDPEKNRNAELAACHGHYHYLQFAAYRLVGDAGTTLVQGRKQAFCAFDYAAARPDAGPGKYSCQNQGISVGWADIYNSYLDCQWIDVTDVPPGDYTLEVEVNPGRRIAEQSYSNNVARVPVKVPAGTGCFPRPEICADGQDNDCDGAADEGCNPITTNESCRAIHYLQMPGEYTAAITPSTQADLSPSCGGEGGDLVFHFSLMVPELVYLSTYGSTVDTVLSVRDGNCMATDSECVDDACSTGQSHIAKVMSAGPHFIVVKAKNRGATGTVKLTYQTNPCTAAKPIAGPSTVRGDTSATGDRFSLSCGAAGGNDDLWYFASCPGQTLLTASTCGSGFQTALALKRGSCRGLDTACEAARCSLTGARLDKPGLWFLVVDGAGSGQSGPYQLEVQY